jgi:hypothetical protein
MRDLLPMVVGWGMVIAVIGYMGLRPESWLARHLRTSVHVVPSGPDGSYRRRDFVRFAGTAAAVGVGCWVLSLGSGLVGERFVNLSQGNRIATAYSFGFFLFGGLAFAVALAAVWAGIRLRGQARETDESGGTTA